MLDEQQIRELVIEHGVTVNQGRPIKQIIEDGDIPRLSGAVVLEGKVSDSVFREDLVTKSGEPIRLMFRNNRISTHDVNQHFALSTLVSSKRTRPLYSRLCRPYNFGSFSRAKWRFALFNGYAKH